MPVNLQAILADGLPVDSRSAKKITGRKLTLTEELLAAILDGVNLLLWQRSKDAEFNRNKPASILQNLTENKEETNVVAFSSAGEFEARKAAILKGNGDA